MRSSACRFWVGGAVLVVCIARTEAAVNLELRTLPGQVLVGDTVDVGLFAVASGDVDEVLSGLDVILSWDERHFELQEALDNGPHAWSFWFGLSDDSELDGLNDSLLDGNAYFQAASFGTATAPPGGLLVATLRFVALAGAELSQIRIEPEFGLLTRTQVLIPGGDNVTGSLGSLGITVAAASLQSVDMVMPAGRVSEALVRGSITGLSTFGLSVLMEIVPRKGTTGTVTFTPESDVTQRGDPWPGAGGFTGFDVGVTPFTETKNGSLESSGESIASPVFYTGPLTGFPLLSSLDATGAWDLLLTVTDNVEVPVDSSWEELDTTLVHGTLRIVDQGDGNGDTGVDLRDFSELQVCYSSDQVAYSLTPELRCVVYDFDDDGDVDIDDFVLFSDAVSGPVQ